MNDTLETILAWGGLALLVLGIAWAIRRLMANRPDLPSGSNPSDPATTYGDPGGSSLD